MVSYVPQGGCSKQGITDRMQQHIGIRMAQKTLVEINLYTAYYQITAFDKLMNIVSVSYPYHLLPSQYSL